MFIWFKFPGRDQRDAPAKVQHRPQGQQVLQKAAEEGVRVHRRTLRGQGQVPGDRHAREKPRPDAPGHRRRAQEQLHGVRQGAGWGRSGGRVPLGNCTRLLPRLLRLPRGGTQAPTGTRGRQQEQHPATLPEEPRSQRESDQVRFLFPSGITLFGCSRCFFNTYQLK